MIIRDLYGSFTIAGIERTSVPAIFSDTICNDLSRSLRIAGQFKCCFHTIVGDC